MSIVLDFRRVCEHGSNQSLSMSQSMLPQELPYRKFGNMIRTGIEETECRNMVRRMDRLNLTQHDSNGETEFHSTWFEWRH